MKKLTFKTLFLLSKKAQRARKIEFDPEVNVITGDNDTGKSSLLKSLYHTFGASPINTPTNWDETSEISAVEFELDKSTYILLRHKTMFALFDKKKTLLGKYEGIGRESGIGAVLADMFGFSIQMQDKSGKSRLLPPAYFFLPFCIDQDSGWHKLWESYAGLQQFSDYKTMMINYHIGILPKRYFDIKQRIDEISKDVEPIKLERNAVIEAQKRFKTNDAIFDMDLNAFKQETQSLVLACQKLREKEEKYKSDLSELEKQSFMLKRQAEIAETARVELEKDHKYVLAQTSKGHIECPTCGTEFQNAITKRFKLVEDVEMCHRLVLDLCGQQKAVEGKISLLNEGCNQNQKELSELQSLLEAKNGEMTLKDIIGSESKKEVRRLLREDIERFGKIIEKLQMELDELKAERLNIQDKSRIQKINNSYSQKLRDFLTALDVSTVSQTQCEKPTSKLNTAGSDLPRALLAQYYSILHVMAEFSPDYLPCPLIVDSPLQQDPDYKNIKKIMQFVLEKRPKNCQLILGTVETHGLKYPGKTIELATKHRVLNDQDFKVVNPLLTELLDKTLME